MYEREKFVAMHEDPKLFAAVVVYIIFISTFLLNFLDAQLMCLYQSTYLDRQAFARLNCGKIVVESMPLVSKTR